MLQVITKYSSRIRKYPERVKKMKKAIKSLLMAAIIVSIILSTCVVGFADTTLDKSSKYNWDHILMGCYGFVTGGVSHPADPSLIYVRTDVGGMYRHDPENGEWIQLFEGIEQKDIGLASVRSIALDPNDTNVVWAACGGSKGTTDILVSYDKGDNWTQTKFFDRYGARCGNNRVARAIGESLVIDPNNSDVMYFGTERNGLYITENKGATWTKSEDIPDYGWPTGGVASIWLDSTQTKDGRTKDIYISSWGYGVYKSTDCGKTFSLIEGSPRVPCQVQVVRDGLTEKMYVSSYNPNYVDYYVGADDTGKVETTELGAFYLYQNGVWEDISPQKNTGEASYTSYSSFLIDKRDSDIIILSSAPWPAVGGSKIWRSTNGGTTFSSPIKSYQASALFQDGADPDKVWMPFGGGVAYIPNFRTFTSYDQIIRHDVGIETICATKLASLPGTEDAPKLLILSQDHSLRVQEEFDMLAPDNAVAPEFNHGGGIDFCEEDPSFVFRVGTDGKHNEGTGTAAISTDYGRTYKEVGVGTLDKNMRFVDCAVGATLQDNGYPILMLLSVGKTNGENDGNGIYRSLDGGATWELMSSVPCTRNKASYDYNNCLIASDRVDGNTFYYTEPTESKTGVAGRVFRTQDGGDFWKTLTPKVDGVNIEIPRYGAFIKALPEKEGHVWLKGTQGRIYTSEDFGKSWSHLDTIVEAQSDASAIGFGIGNGKSGNPAVYVGGYVDGVFGIYLSDDLGKHWMKISPEGQNFFAGIVNIYGDRREYGRVFVATGGNGVIYGEKTGELIKENYASGQKLTIKSEGINNTPVPQQFMMIAAFYDENGNMFDIDYKQITSAAEEGIFEYSMDITVPKNAEHSTLKVFNWRPNLAPLTIVCELKQQE